MCRTRFQPAGNSASAGLDHRTDYILYAYLDTGDFEDVRLDETFDLRGKESVYTARTALMCVIIIH